MTTIVCPVCSCDWPTQPTRCVCGYDFETGNTHEAVRSLSIVRRRANNRWVAGLVTLASTLGTIVLGTMYPAMWLAMPIIVAVQVLFGLGLISTGLRTGITVSRQLARAKTMNALPAARVVKH